MRGHLFSALLLTMIALPGISSGQNGTGTATTTVTATPASVTVGGTVGFTASVQANSVSAGKAVTKPTGGITFLDGSTPLNTAPISLVPGGYSSATFPQTFGTPNTALTQRGTSQANGELTGDLNGDGIPDLLVYQYLPPYSVQTFTSNGKSGYTAGAVQTFNFPITAEYPNVTNVPQLIDVNDDGKLDLLCGLLVAYGNGDGTFAAAVPVSFLSSGFVTSYAADLNGDGKTDILAVDAFPDITVNPSSVQFAVTVLLNQGAGSFTSAGTFPVTAQQLVSSAGFATVNFFPPTFVDLNGDGKLDLIAQTQTVAATNIGGDPAVDALLNNGDGTFGSFIPVSVPDPPNSIGGTSAYGAASGDVNGDGKQDLILTLADNLGLGNLDAITLLGNGDGSFKNPLYLTLATAPSTGAQYYETPAVVVQDFNLNGKLDLIFGDGQLALGNGDGTFSLSSPLFPAQILGETTTNGAFPLVPMTLPGNLVPSLVFFLQTVTPPAASVFTPLPSSSATLSVTSLSAGAHTITAQYSGDANYATDTSTGVAVTVSQATSATAVMSSANPSFAGQSVTLTASVASTGPTPTGNMIFTSGSTTLGTVALSGGSAAYTTTSLTAAGTQTITATYSGDANTQASSGTINQVINAVFTPAPANGGSPTLTVKSGQTVTTSISVTGAAGFSGQVALACSGLPAGAACSFTPATVAVSGTTPATSSLTVNTGASAAAAALAVQEMGAGIHRIAYGFTFGSFLLLGVLRRRGRNIWALFGCLLLLCSLGLTACGGNSTPAGTAPGTYNFTVTSTSGNLKASSTLTLNVQ
jgi:hypothetical protein